MAQPLAPLERDVRLDGLRGLALLGVLLLNLPVYARTPFGAPWVESLLPGVGNLGPALWEWLGRGKFVAILAGLYGYGMGMRAWRGSSGATELRRLGFLLALGVVHGLCWPGDILVSWALTGTILLLPPSLPVVPIVVTGLLLPAALLALGYGAWIEPTRRAVLASHATSGVAPLLLMWSALPTGLPPMVAQATIGRWLATHPAPRHARALLPVGLALAAIPALPLLLPLSLPGWFHALCGDVGATALAAGLAAVILGRPSAGGPVLRWFAPVGAAPLSNYLLQTMIFLAWPPRGLHTLGYLGVALVTFAVQRAVTARWLRTHARGPLEALWRRATYR
jgi:uncharacterized protein